jgi:MFS family permease
MTGRDSLAPLTHAPFRWLLASRTVAMLGNVVAPVAVAFAVLDLTGSPAALGLVLAARSLPQVLFLLVGGVVADRFSRRTVVVVAAAVSALTQAVAAAAVLSGRASVELLAGVEAVNGAASAFIFPAAAGLTPLTVPATLLQPANALLRLGMNAAMILGAAAGAALVAVAGPGWGLAVDALTFAAAAVLLLPLALPAAPAPSPAPAEADETAPDLGSSPWDDLRVGWHEVVSHTWLWVVVLCFTALNASMAGMLGVLGPVIADETVGRAAWGTVLAAQSVGLVLGGLVALRARLRRPLASGLSAMLLVLPFLAALALDPGLAVLVLLATLAGVGVEVFSVGWDVALQENVPTDRLSRVYSFDMLGSFVAIPLGQMLVGPAASAVGTEAAVLGVTALVAAAIGVALAVPSVRRLGRVAAPDRGEPAAVAAAGAGGPA